MNKPPMHEVYNTIVGLLANAMSNDMFADMRDRFNTDMSYRDRIEEKHGYKLCAKKSWAAAKHLYCMYKEDLDQYYEQNKFNYNRDNNQYFDAMKTVIEEEMIAELENTLCDVSDTNNINEQEKEQSEETVSENGTQEG